MKRKLVKQGAATMMISLPSNWIKANKLNKGDEVYLEENSNDLIIRPESLEKEKREITIDITQENKGEIKNLLTHAYRMGFEKINLSGPLSGLSKEINFVVNNFLLGFEITERSSTKCLIENISEPHDSKYSVIQKKAFDIIKETSEIVLKDFQDKNLINAKEIEEMRNQQDRFILFCRRLLIQNRYESSMASEWELLTFLMHIQHSYYYLYEFSSKNKIKIEKDMTELLAGLKDYFILFYTAYKNKNIDNINKINTLKDKYQFGKCFEVIAKTKGNSSVVYSIIREIFREIQIGTSPILGEIFDNSMKKPTTSLFSNHKSE